MRNVHIDDALEYYIYQTTFNQNGSLFKSYDVDVGMQCI